MGSLSNLYISQSYQSLIHLATNNTASATLIGLEDGLGNSIGVSVNTAGNLYLSGTFSASLQEGYIYVGNSSGRTIAFPTSSFISELETGSLLTTASFNAYTASTNIRLSNIEITTASVLVSISNLNASSASQQVSINALNVFTQSANTRLNNLETTSASVNTSITNINAYTQSNDAKWQDLGSKSGSWITESETGSFARYDVSNPWSANQTFTNITAVSASFTYVQTVFETASVIYSSGSNQFGDELTDVQTLSGSVKIRGGLLINNLDVTGSINNINSFTSSAAISINNLNQFTASQSTASIVTSINNLNSFTQSANIRLNNLESTSASVNTSITNINSTTASLLIETSNLETFSASALVSISNLNSTTASQQISINALNAATASYVTETESGSFLITASFDNGTRNLTFTKGNNTTFAVNIPDVSGSAGDFVTTSSFNAYTSSNNQRVSSLEANSASVNTSISNINSFTQSANVSISALNSATASYVTEVESGSFLITGSVAGNVLTFTKGDNTTFNLTVATGSGGGGSTDTGSLLVTASFASTNITFTKGDATTFKLDGFATTGSNTFRGNQTLISSSINLQGSGQISFPNGFSLSGNATDIAQLSSATTIQFITEPPAGPGGTNDIKFINRVSGSSIIFQNSQGGAGNNITFEGGDVLFNIVQASGSSGKVRFGNTPSIDASNTTFTASLQQGYAWVGNQSGVSVAVATSSFAGASVPAGTISGSAQITALGFVSSSITGSSLITASVNLNTITFTKGDNTTFALTVNTGSGGGGGQTFANPSVESISGSLVLSALTFNSGAANLLHLSASAQNQANLVFKNNNLTGTTQVSGSNNIFVNPTAPTANFARFVGGTGNIYMNSGSVPQITASAASVSGNRPTMNNNIIPSNITWNINQASNPGAHIYSNNILENGTINFNTTGNTGAVTFSNNIGLTPTIGLNAPSASVANVLAGVSGSNVVSITSNVLAQGTIQYFGPVSSSTHNIQQNVIGGTLTMNVQSGSRGYTVSNNTMNGTLTINDQVVNGPTVGSANAIGQNSINGAVTLTNRASASVTMNGNSLGGFTITNDYDSMTNGTVGRTFNVNGNYLLGFIANNIYFSGSAAGTGTTNDRGRGLYGNVIGGNRISASVIGDGNRHLIASAIVGLGLNIYGTSLYDASNATLGGQNGGSAFFGRFNAEDGNRALSAQTVFVVGTGTSGSTGLVRKTGFLIDSGSNTFIEGTLNVSGSSTLSGSLYIQSGSTLPVSTGSAILTWNAATGQVNQASFSTIVSASVSSAEFWSTTTQSGSAGVSGSITFNNSGSFYNVSLVSGTRLTVANAGVYNIQFSAQIETSAGADTVYIWFKKNGTNIGDSASKAVLANNTAQIMTVNILDEAVANDYYEIAYQTLNGNATVLAEVASGNIPAIPSVITTIIQVR